MRIKLFLVLLVMCTTVIAQTPFEFAVVQDLIQGSPFISVLRIKIVPGSPMPGRTQLEISTRAGMILYGESSIYPDSLTDGNVSFVGLAEYSATLPTANVERIFSVLQDCLRRFPGTGITDISLDVVSIDDMSWMAVECPVSSIDSLLEGSVSHLEFWRRVSLRELEVGTAAFQTMLQWPGVPADYTPQEVAPVVVSESRSTEPWKSLILPGWGQLDAGVGAGWVNLLVEAGGIALLVSGEDEAGIAVLGANHLVSFVDLF